MGLSKKLFAVPKRGIVVAVTGVVFAGAAIAATPTVMKGTARVGGRTNTVLVSSAGQTLYTVSGERVGNLKCLTKTCFAVWLPLKVGANDTLTKGPGVSGTLSKLHRVKGRFYQVMLDGHPLYSYSGDDKTKGNAKGDGIRSFGGTWHVVTP